MKTYERIFGAGPRGAVISTLLVLSVYYMEDKLNLDIIFVTDGLRYVLVSALCAMGLWITIWSLISLPVDKRGRALVTTGAFKYFRHPLYAAFLLFFNVAFALFMNNWIYVIWAVMLFPIWSINVRTEEQLMRQRFGEEYQNYCSRTRQFIPGIF